MQKQISKSLQWLIGHAFTIFSCVAIIALGIGAVAYATTIGVNISTDGTLLVSSNTTLATTTISGGDLIVDTDTLIVDNDNNRVGFGTSTPLTLVDINGDLSLENQGLLRLYEIRTNGNSYAGLKATSSMASDIVWSLPNADGTIGQMLTTNGSGNMYWASATSPQWTTSGNNIYYNTGSVGIGTTSPFALLSVNASAGSNTFSIGSSTATNFIVDKNGYVGIGTASPTEKLTVNGNIQLTGTGNLFSVSEETNTITTDSGTNFGNSILFGDSNTLSGSTYINNGSLLGFSNTLSDGAHIDRGSLYGYDNTLSGSAFIYGSSLYGDSNILSGGSSIYIASLYGENNTLSDNAQIYESSLYGDATTISGGGYIYYGSLYGYNNTLYGQFSDGTVVGDSNTLYGTRQYNLNLFGNDNSINEIYNSDTDYGNAFVVGDNNTIGRSYDFTVSGTTVTIVGDITPYISDGNYSFNALTGGTNDTLYSEDRTISNIAFGGSNTTFTIDSELDDRTGGRFLVGNLHDVVVFGNNQEVYRNNYYTFDGKLNIDGLTGNVGIGTTTPATTLDVNGIIKTQPADSRTCDALAEGGIMYDSDDSHFYGCNGSTWVRLDYNP